ncbi:MAG TPA: hypothetical protein VFB06_11505 [Streptosporangiaceae bacterium]|nr:hypothetical protein [Streptosporangiaceae bacterium]
MSADNRILALQYAIETVVPDGGGFPPEKGGDVTAVADIYYRWLEGPAVLFLTADPVTFDQAAPEGPGTPTIRKGTAAVQLTDLQQVTLSIAEEDSKGQPVADSLVWSVDDPGVISLVPSADTQSCLCVAGTDGTATVTVTDNSVTPPLTGTETITVVSSAATSLVINEGTPEDQPPAPAPGS